jgi:hypothetical protein
MFLLSFAAFVYFAELSTDDIDKDDDGNKADASGGAGDEEGDSEEEMEGIFIPYWYPEQGPLEFYKATDPEYQEFLKFNKNDKRQAYVIRKSF